MPTDPIDEASLVIAQAIVPARDDPARLDRVVVELFGELVPARARARKLCARGAVLLDGTAAEGSRWVEAGQRVELLEVPDTRKVHRRSLPIAFEDEHLAAVVKPGGLLTSGNRHRTLDNALPFNFERSTAPDALQRARPVHRLDYLTSGLVLVARSARAQIALGRTFQHREVHKRYRAYVVGRLEGEGRVDSPIEGRSAQSSWRVVRHFPSLHTQWITEVELEPHTGRTHQLRLHMVALGHPVLGDVKYTEGRVYQGKGLFLHAEALRLAHPVHGTPLELHAEPPPKFTSYRLREIRRVANYSGGDDSESASRSLS